jgi:hypothetical protein
VKVAICVPHYGDTVKSVFAYSLANLTGYVGGNPRSDIGRIELQLFMKPGLLPMVRNEIKDDALRCGADWLLWLDADMLFPADTLYKLLLDRQPIVGANCLMRQGDFYTAFNFLGDWRNGQVGRIETTQEKAERDLIEPADAVGTGILLVASDVFKKVSAEPFQFQRAEDGSLITEDVSFMVEAKAAGFQPHVDHALSWHCGHAVPMIKRPVRAHSPDKSAPR